MPRARTLIVSTLMLYFTIDSGTVSLMLVQSKWAHGFKMVLSMTPERHGDIWAAAWPLWSLSAVMVSVEVQQSRGKWKRVYSALSANQGGCQQLARYETPPHIIHMRWINGVEIEYIRRLWMIYKSLRARTGLLPPCRRSTIHFLMYRPGDLQMVSLLDKAKKGELLLIVV